MQKYRTIGSTLVVISRTARDEKWILGECGSRGLFHEPVLGSQQRRQQRRFARVEMLSPVPRTMPHEINRVPVGIPLPSTAKTDSIDAVRAEFDQRTNRGPATAIIGAQKRCLASVRAHRPDPADHATDRNDDQQGVNGVAQEAGIFVCQRIHVSPFARQNRR